MWYDKVYVMSYKYGLIDPDMEIEPYDINIRYSSAKDKLLWWATLRKQIVKLVEEEKPKLVALYTGNYERERVMREFVRAGFREVIIPFSDCTVGQRMQRVYDMDPPFTLEELEAGKYTLPENFGEPKRRGRPPKEKQESILPDDEIEWEE